MLDSFHIKNFRGCPDWELSFGEKTYIMGPNGSGKTHVLEGIHILAGGGLIYNDTLLADETFFGGNWKTDDLTKIYTTYREGKSDRCTIQ